MTEKPKMNSYKLKFYIFDKATCNRGQMTITQTSTTDYWLQARDKCLLFTSAICFDSTNSSGYFPNTLVGSRDSGEFL